MNFSPLDDKTTGAIVLVMQRLHEDDIAGKLLREGGWEHLNLPAIAEEDENVAIGPHTIHRRRKGDVLHQARELLKFSRTAATAATSRVTFRSAIAMSALPQ